mgnify:CR=1 FL=1
MKKLLALFLLAFGIANAQTHTFKFILSSGPGSGSDISIETYAPCLKKQNINVLKDYKLNFVDGVEILNYHSFPSGHTTFAFAIFTSFAFIYQKPLQQIFFLFCALLVAFSRIYLLQHFLRDTIVGSMIGFVCAFVLFYMLISKKEGVHPESI